MTVITHTRKFKVGKSYTYNDIMNYSADNEFDETDYGGNCVGEEALRLFDKETETNIWFILSSANAISYYYRCVYNSQFEI